MNRNLIYQLAILTIAFLLTGCKQEKDPISVTGVSLSQTSLVMIEGETQTLSATISPSNADNKSVSWTSSQTSVASVQDGVVTAHKVGIATIIVTTVDGGKTATCTVTVESTYKPISDISLSNTSIELAEGDQFTLTATITPENATNKNTSWTSSNTEVATVNNNGKVTAINVGTATITVTTEDGNKTATCKVKVTEKIYPVEDISLDKTEIELTEGDEAILTATITPENATNKNTSWTSSNTEVATVNNNGKVTAINVGTATITVTTEDGNKTATCKVKVTEKIYPVEDIYLDKTEIELTKGDEAILTATITPENATNKNTSWTSSNTEVATVNNNGKVTAINVGTATITVTTEDGNKTATCKVKVTEKIYPVEGIYLDKTKIELTEGDEAILTATIIPENATNKNMIWASSDESIVTVSEGKVTAVKKGTATITVTTEDGNKTATCEVKVKSIVVDGGIEGTEDWWYVK